MKIKWISYSTSIFAWSKPFNKTSLMTLLIAVVLYIVSGIAGSGGVPLVSADEGIVSGVSADEGIVSGVSADEGIVSGVSADEGIVSGVSADESIVSGASAEGMSNGKMGGIIRSANHPCAKVIKLQPDGESSWRVKCNSGSFNVNRSVNGKYNVYAF
jgi:hypothetical protein